MSSPEPTSSKGNLNPQDGPDISSGAGPSTIAQNSTVGNGNTKPANGVVESLDLSDLLATAKDQAELERNVGLQANQMLIDQADERDNKRIDKAEFAREKCLAQLKKVEEKLAGPGGASTKNPLRDQKAQLEEQIKSFDDEIAQIQARIDERHANEDEDSAEANPESQLPNETRREFLIRTGKITPFAQLSTPRVASNLADAIQDAEEENNLHPTAFLDDAGPKSHRNLMKPGFDSTESSDQMPTTEAPASKNRKLIRGSDLKARSEAVDSSESSRAVIDLDYSDSDVGQKRARRGTKKDEKKVASPDKHVTSSLKRRKVAERSGSDDQYVPGESSAASRANVEDDEYTEDSQVGEKRERKTTKSSSKKTADQHEDFAKLDDGNEKFYQARLKAWAEKREAARVKAHGDKESEENEHASEEPEWYKPHPTRQDMELEGGLRIPGDIYHSLFHYQKTGVQWLWELYTQKNGGIIGDEMGLGKTIQMISFLSALHYTKKLNKPIIIVAPATLLKQWVNEFHVWWPPLRVSILHSTGSGMMNLSREEKLEDKLDYDEWVDDSERKAANMAAARRIVNRVVNEGHVLVTTYSGLQTYRGLIVPIKWGYAVLDEGHKIRNPHAAITMHCKELQTHNRVILSGTPMQNNLSELWSLFDFVYPMRLGTLVGFRQQFELPIKHGGYANASNLQVETANRCAEALKEAISPYLLQRFKADVAADLPTKQETVLFCKLTDVQRTAYRTFLNSPEMEAILDKRRQPLFGIDILRKVCNHPDLLDHARLPTKPGYNYGEFEKSGKMKVVKSLVDVFIRHGHKTLLFAQQRITLDILQKLMKTIPGCNWVRMDGNTAIKDRQPLVDKFNEDPNLHVFLLTTKVGGLGINLTGADRVIIFDPDWNPSTDAQARERSWRLGQKREVQVMRLLTAGTIEEKIYHRQIFKQFLANKVLKDPKQRQSFTLQDLHDLFSLSQPSDETQTGNIFQGTKLVTNKGKDVAKKSEPSHTAQISNPFGLYTKDIARHEAYKEPGNSQQSTAGEKNASTEAPANANGSTNASTEHKRPDRLLSAIFSGPNTSLHSAHAHDAIVGTSSNGPRRAKNYVAPDPEIISREARRMADQAAKELRKAHEIARTLPAGTPTWTGQAGIAGRPVERVRGQLGGPGFGRPSSGSVLQNLAARQGAAAGSSGGGGGRGGRGGRNRRSRETPTGKEFMILIRDFLKTHGGWVHTKMLVDHFNHLCVESEEASELFKEVLKRVAVFEYGRNGRGKWLLKTAYGGDA